MGRPSGRIRRRTARRAASAVRASGLHRRAQSRTLTLSCAAAVALLATPALAQSSGDQSGGQSLPQVDCPAGQQRIATGECAIITGPGAGGGAAGAMMGGTSGAAGTTTGTSSAGAASGSGSSGTQQQQQQGSSGN
jgi:hypothetical protein